MSRPLKFKIFDKNDTKALIGPFEWNRLPNFDNPDNFEICQFTGLLDKNLTEIYENDILLAKNGARYLVFWLDVNAEFTIAIINDGIPDYETNFTWRTIMEQGLHIIGNKYENPELLKN